MKKYYTLFIDSGIGGLSTLAETYKILPHNFIYFSDNANCPYGSRSKTEIYKILKNIIINVQKNFQISTVVLACNTATTSAIKKLRETFSKLKFIGTEPAVKLAKSSGCKNILVLCTPATARQKKYLKLTHKTKAKICTLKMFNLASIIEAFYSTPSFASYIRLIKQLYFARYKCKKVDGVVLGCTHYVLIKGVVQKIFKLPVFDGNFGVAKQVFLACTNSVYQNKTNSNNFCANNSKCISPLNFDNFCKNSNVELKNDIILIFSKKEPAIKEKYIKTFMQILANN